MMSKRRDNPKVFMGARLRQIRLSRGLSQQAVAEQVCALAGDQIEYGQPMVSQWESGKHAPTLRYLVALATWSEGALPVAGWVNPSAVEQLGQDLIQDNVESDQAPRARRGRASRVAA